MNRIMYEVNWHYINGSELLEGITITPITITRYSILPGCERYSITAKDNNGCEFIGNINDYFDTEQQARDSVQADIVGSMVALGKEIDKKQEQLLQLGEVLRGLPA